MNAAITGCTADWCWWWPTTDALLWRAGQPLHAGLAIPILEPPTSRGLRDGPLRPISEEMRLPVMCASPRGSRAVVTPLVLTKTIRL